MLSQQHKIFMWLNAWGSKRPCEFCTHSCEFNDELNTREGPQIGFTYRVHLNQILIRWLILSFLRNWLGKHHLRTRTLNSRALNIQIGLEDYTDINLFAYISFCINIVHIFSFYLANGDGVWRWFFQPNLPATTCSRPGQLGQVVTSAVEVRQCI